MKYSLSSKGLKCLQRLLSIAGVLLASGAALAQGDPHQLLLERLAGLEKRQGELEAENELLRDRITRLEAGQPPSGVMQQTGAASASSGAGQTVSQTGATAEARPQRVELGAEVRLRSESRSDFSERIALNNFLLQRIRLHMRLRASENISGLVQLQDSRFWGQELTTASNEANADLHQAYLQVDQFLHPRLSVRIGRQELLYGNERLLGAFGWDNVGRAFDGVKLAYATPSWSADLFLNRLEDRRNAGRGDGSQDLIGLYTQLGGSNSRMGLEPYALYLRDGLEIAGEQPQSARRSTRVLTLGFRHFAHFANGFGYDLENAYQVGRRGPDAHRAAAVAGRGSYRFAMRFAPEVGLEYDFATGDADPRDGRSGEFHNLFPTNHPHYGYADFLGWRNMHAFKSQLALTPVSGVRAELSYLRLLLAERRGPWKNAAGKVLGFDPTGLLGADLGHELDLTLTFPLYEKVRMLGGYSLFLPGKFAQRTQGSQAAQFGYLQSLITF